MGIISLNYGGENEAPLGDNSILETARRPWGHSDSLRGKILFPEKGGLVMSLVTMWPNINKLTRTAASVSNALPLIAIMGP